MSVITEAPVWKTIRDSLGLVLVVWAIPVGILVVGAPIALAVALVRWLL